VEISKLNKNITPSGTMAISNNARVLKEQGKPVIGFGAVNLIFQLLHML